MPMYPYECCACNYEFEVRRKMSDDGNEYCPKCSAQLTIADRVVAAISFKLEGNGWYKDGYGGKEAQKYAFQD